MPCPTLLRRGRRAALVWLIAALGASLPGAAAPFCPFKLPGDGKLERFLNLTVVQYVDVSDDAVVIAYGGGNFGSGHEMKIRTSSRAEGLDWLRRINDAAKACEAPNPGPQGTVLPRRPTPLSVPSAAS